MAQKITEELWRDLLMRAGPDWAEIEAVWYSALAGNARDNSAWHAQRIFLDMANEATQLMLIMSGGPEKPYWADSSAAIAEFTRRIEEYVE